MLLKVFSRQHYHFQKEKEKHCVTRCQKSDNDLISKGGIQGITESILSTTDERGNPGQIVNINSALDIIAGKDKGESCGSIETCNFLNAPKKKGNG